MPRMESVPVPGDGPEPDTMSIHSDDSDNSDGSDNLFAGVPVDDLDTHLWEEDGERGPSVGELVLMLVDYISAHKLTQAAADDCWNLLRMACPPDKRPRAYSMVRGLVQRHLAHTLVKVDICINGCVAFHNCTSAKLAHYQYYDLDECPNPRCGASRWVRKKGKRVAARVLWWLPSKYYWRYMFSQPELVSRIANNRCPSQST